MLKLRSVNFAYREKDETFFVNTARSVRNDRVSLEINTDGNEFSINIHTSSPVTVEVLTAEFEYPFDKSDRIFLNGYQSWTDSTEHGINGIMRGIERVPAKLAEKYALSQYGDYNFTTYPNIPGLIHGWSYGYVRRKDEFDFMGSLSESSGFTNIRISSNNDSIVFTQDCNGVEINGDHCGMHLLLKTGTEDEVFDDYFSRLKVSVRPEVKPIFGYTSWYRHYNNISDEILLKDLEGLASQKYKADVFQIDDGYQTAVGDWLMYDEVKFPDGMKKIASKISEQGMIPGIWLAPFAASVDSEIYCYHKEWLLRDSSGHLVKGGSNWGGFYALDIYNEDVRDYLREVFSTIINDWGFRLLKLDFLYAACICPRADKTRGTVMADAMEFLREISGDALLIGCGVPLASAFGKVDYCRIGCDVSPDWDGKPLMKYSHRERVSTKNSLLNTVFRRQLNGRAFLNDPDVFMLREEENEMTDEQRHTLSEINAIAGSVMLTSDDISAYNEDQQAFLHRIMALREAKVISAIPGKGKLLLKVAYKGKTYTRIYEI